MAAFAATLLALCAGCVAGNGSTLDDAGRSLAHPFLPPLGSRLGIRAGDAGRLNKPSYDAIANQIFVPYCVSCHSGGNAALGLDLNPEFAFKELFEKASTQKKTMLLVDPEKPDDSYLIRKLEGGPQIVGRQMPRNRPSRPQAEIDIIRAWITSGAKEDATDE